MAWNKPSEENQQPKKPSAKAPSAKRGVIAGAVVVALGVLCLWLFSGKETRQDAASTKERGRIKEVTPAAAQTNATVRQEKKVAFWNQPTTNGLSEAQIRKWEAMHRKPAAYTNNVMALYPKPKCAIFETHAENEIAFLMTLEPGASLFGTRRYSEKFKQEFLKSCETPIIVTKDDDEYTAQLKRDMIATKIELRNRMADGEDLGEILTETRNELRRLGEVKRMVAQEMRSVIKETATSEADIDASIAAANKMLEDKGVAPIKVSPVMRMALIRSLKLKQENKGETK